MRVPAQTSSPGRPSPENASGFAERLAVFEADLPAIGWTRARLRSHEPSARSAAGDFDRRVVIPGRRAREFRL